MMTIESVRQEQVEKLRHEFFSPESREERLGSSGRWQGVGARRLGLDNPVRETAFANLLAGRTPDGTRSLLVQGPDPECPAGWRVTFTASQSVSVLWAMAPQGSRTEIERVHAQCVEAALIDFEQILCHHTLWAPAHVADRFLGGVFAWFRRGAAWDQTPHLHTTVFCMNLGVVHDQSARRFDPHRILETKNVVTPYYHRIFEWGLYRSLGPFRRFASKELRVHGIPQELCRRFFWTPASPIARTPTAARGPGRCGGKNCSPDGVSRTASSAGGQPKPRLSSTASSSSRCGSKSGMAFGRGSWRRRVSSAAVGSVCHYQSKARDDHPQHEGPNDLKTVTTGIRTKGLCKN